MYSKVFYINNLRFDLVTRLNKFSIHNIIKLESFEILLKTNNNFLNELDFNLFKLIFLLE